MRSTTQSIRAELRETFLYTRDESGLDAAIDALINAIVAIAPSRRPAQPKPASSPPADKIIAEACAKFGISERQFFGELKLSLLCDCRAVATVAMRSLGMGLQQIATKLGRKDHTVAIAYLARADRDRQLIAMAHEILGKVVAADVLTEQGRAA